MNLNKKYSFAVLANVGTSSTNSVKGRRKDNRSKQKEC
jgi:hypothetical protein